jgi:hypothetical protein
MATLTGQSIASSYEQLLHVDRDGGGNSTTLVNIKDGDNGTTFALQMATDKIQVNGSATITTDDNTTQLSLISTDDDANVGPALELYRNSASPANSDLLGTVYFFGEDGAGNKEQYARIESVAGVKGSGSEEGVLNFYTNNAGTLTNNRLAITGSETVLNESSGNFDFRVESNGNANMLFVDAGNDRVGIGTASPKHYSGTSGTVLSIHDSSYRGILELSGASNSDDGVIGAITFANTENDADKGALAQIYTIVETSDSNAGDDSGGHLSFLTRPEAGTLTERMRIDSNGKTRITASTAEVLSLRSSDTNGSHIIFEESTTARGYVGIAGSVVTSGGDNFVVRSEADLLLASGGNNIRMVIDANSRISLSNNDNNVGSTVFGYNALDGNTDNDSDRNTAIGYGALDGIGSTTASDNIAIGYDAIGGTMTATNNDNVAIGNYSMDQGMTNSSSNIAVGKNAFGSATAITSCVAVGTGAFANVSTIIRGVAIGEGALGGAESADYSVAVGYSSMYNTTGAKNTALGYQSANTVTDGTENTVVGYDADASASGAVNQTVIGSETTGQADNSVTLGNSSVGSLYIAPGNTSGQTIFFNDASQAGWIQYDHGADQMKFASANTINARLNNGSLEPGATDTQDLGSTTRKWDEVHANYVLSQGNQNHVANTMSSPYYRFDGVDDVITPSSALGLINSPFSISFWVRNKTDSTDYEAIYSQDSTEIWFGFGGTSAQGTIRLHIGGSDYIDTATGAIIDGVWTHVTGTWDGTNGKIYVNGVNQTIATTNGTLNNPTSQSAYRIGLETGGGNAFRGELNNLSFWNNTLTATEVKELYSGASVAYKYKGANQTDMVTNGGFSSGSNWTISGGWDINTTTSGKARFLKDGSGIDYIEQDVGLIKGKRYRLTFTISDATNAQLAIYNNSTANYASIQNSSPSFAHFTNTANGTYVVDFLATASGKLVIAGHQNSGSAWDLDDVSLVPIGAVAEYDGSGIASDKWFDKSGNDLHGAVSGATVENAPSGDDGLIYEEGSWTPTDASSAGLSLAQAVGRYVRVGNKVTAWGFVEYPTTSDGQNAEVHGLPYNIFETDPVQGGSVTYTNQGAMFMIFCRRNTDDVEFIGANGSALTNANLSAKQVNFCAIYFT